MQVTQTNDHCTHAIIGGKQSIEFGISSSAEFFNILSSTLYKDQILAVVRETLCNAWDAHIEAGCTNKPVEVTLTGEKFTIKDYGTGIHHDDMGPIYGTYGNSTKKNDGKQTGGFGLGCKSPFAYTDHFEVISCHSGVKTIYTLSKSSAQAQGKPGITPIASFPTEETGLQVSIQVKNAGDYTRFKELITRIARNGDMNLSLNGNLIEPLGFNSDKCNYFITGNRNILDTDSRIMVRYGNVIYPVDMAKEVSQRYATIASHLKTLTNSRVYQIIFQAPPHSISVTPSRESLSMQEHTVNTLNGLFADFLALLEGDFKKECSQFAITVTEQAAKEGKIDKLLSHAERLPFDADTYECPNITNTCEMAMRFMQINYPQSLEFRKQDITRRLELLVKSNVLNRGTVATYLRALNTVSKTWTDRTRYVAERSNWLHRRVLAPLVTKLSTAGIDPTRLYVCDSYASQGYRKSGEVPLIKATEACPSHLFSTLPYLRNIVVLATAKKGLEDRAFKHEVFKRLGKNRGFLFYHVSMKAVDKAAAIAFFNNSGLEVVDLTQPQGEEKPKRTPTVRKPTKQGVVALSAIQYGEGVYTFEYHKESATRVTDPEFIIQLSFRTYSYATEICDLNSTASGIVVKLFGSKGGLVHTTTAKDKWIAKGAKEAREYITEKVCEYLVNNPRIKQYWENHPDNIKKELYGCEYVYPLIDAAHSSSVLAKEFSLTNPLTEEDKSYLYLWRQLNSRGDWYRYKTPQIVENTISYLAAIPLNVASTSLISKIKESTFLNLIDMRALLEVINNSNSDPATSKKAIAFLLSTLNS